MSLYKVGVFLLLVFLGGCDVGREGEVPSVGSEEALSVKNFSTSSITLSNGYILNLGGRVVRYELVRKDKLISDRYVVESSDSLMGIESRIFADLALQGYTRRIEQQSPERFLVIYSRKGQGVIVADYRAKKNSSALASLIINVRG
jgi:hypothetical protein